MAVQSEAMKVSGYCKYPKGKGIDRNQTVDLLDKTVETIPEVFILIWLPTLMLALTQRLGKKQKKYWNTKEILLIYHNCKLLKRRDHKNYLEINPMLD